MPNEAKDRGAASGLKDPNPKFASMRYSKKEIIPILKLVADQPAEHSDLIGYTQYADRLHNLLIHSLPATQFSVCIDGKAGQGKTSIMKHIFLKIKDSPNSNNLTLWFDAWKYEKLEPNIALLTAIIEKLEAHKIETKALKEILISLSQMNVSPSIGESKQMPDTPFSRVLKHIGSDIDGKHDLSEILGDKRLFIFIDNLERCKGESIDEMFRVMGTQFNYSRIRFVVAADLDRLERKLAPLDGYTEQDRQGPHYLGDISRAFQLRFKLPSKDFNMMLQYVNSIVGSFPLEAKTFLAAALPPNTRQAKEALNLAFYLSNITDDVEFGRLFPYILAWSILDSTYRRLSRILHTIPEILFELMLMVSKSRDFADFIRILSMSTGDSSLLLINLKISRDSISSLTITLAYDLVKDDPPLYDFLKAMASTFQVSTLLDADARKYFVDRIAAVSRLS